ncbi:MAG: hemolysin family protein [Verrucomicrobiota bacterium]|nr:hemolysin family protein [Verrucomicrobiota bacterium]
MSGHAVLVSLVLASLVALSALFSAIETALFSLQPFQIRRLREKRPRLNAALEKLMENPRRVLSVILLGDALANVPLMLLCLFLMRTIFPAYIPFWIEALVLFAVVVVLCDLVPKMVALARPYRIAEIGVTVLRTVAPIAGPVSRLLENAVEKMVELCLPAKFQPKTSLDEEELETLVELGAEEGVLQGGESAMIQEIIKLGDRNVKDCMTPRIEMFALPDDLSNEEAIQKLRAARHRRVPIYGDSPDEILGILDAAVFLADTKTHYTEIMSPPSYVPETMKALDLLRGFFAHPQGMAVIVDEFGGTEGIITRSDMIEEILSEAVPIADRELYIEHYGENQIIVNGSVRLDDLSDYLGIEFESEGVDTLSGLIFNHLGYLPKPGTELKLKGVEMRIRRSSRKRVAEVLVTRKIDPEVAPV